MECPHPNLNQVSFDTRIWKQKSLREYILSSESPVTRGEDNKNIGFALLPCPGVIVMHQGQQGRIGLVQNSAPLLVPQNETKHMCLTFSDVLASLDALVLSAD